MQGELAILSVGEGHNKLIFDKDADPTEKARSARIVKDMLRRGYLLFVETAPKKKGKKPQYEKVIEFKEDTCEYIIADIDTPPDVAEPAQDGSSQPITKRKIGRPRKAVPASDSKAIGVARTAGG